MAGIYHSFSLGCLFFALCDPWKVLSQTVSTASFTLMTNSNYGASALGSNWTVPSLTSCVMTCRVKYPTCYSVAYTNGTKTCTPGNKISYGIPAPSVTAGSRFYYTDFCNKTLGFRLFIYKSVVECLYVAKASANFSVARTVCSARNARVMQAKTQDRFDLFLYIALNIIRTYTFLGLTDLITDGTWLWEDGEAANDTWLNTIFLPYEGYVTPAEDCAVTANYSSFKWVYDGRCDLLYPAHYFICELII